MFQVQKKDRVIIKNWFKNIDLSRARGHKGKVPKIIRQEIAEYTERKTADVPAIRVIRYPRWEVDTRQLHKKIDSWVHSPHKI